MTDPKIRNHPTVIIQNLVALAVIAAIVLISVPTVVGLVIFAAILAIGALMLAWFWSKTTISFTPENIVVEHDLLFKKRKTIPYSKIASVNVVRNVFNRIFGTTTLSININSSMNANTPEACFAFKKELAEEIRSGLSKSLYKDDHTSEETEAEEEPVISFSPKEVFVHCVFGVSTFQFILALLLLAYSVLSTIFIEGAGVSLAIIILIVGEVIPIAFMYIRYYNFRIYRTGNTIRIQHGAIQTYRSSFDIDRINAIRIKKTYLAKIIGRSSLEAEVVGINAVSGEVTPILSLLTDDAKMAEVEAKLIPEFMEGIEYSKQPRTAMYPLLYMAAIASLAVIAVMAYPCYWTMYLADISFRHSEVIRLVPLAATAITVLCMFYAAHVSYRVREFGMGRDLFSFVNGLLDRETVIIQYDRVQISVLAAGRIARRFSLAKAKVSMLSPLGNRSVQSGYFDAEELGKISETMMDRLSSGKYDYRKNGI